MQISEIGHCILIPARLKRNYSPYSEIGGGGGGGGAAFLQGHQEQSVILLVSVNMAVLRIVIIIRIAESGNRRNPRFILFLGQVGTRLKSLYDCFNLPLFHFGPSLPYKKLELPTQERSHCKRNWFRSTVPQTV